MKRKSLRALFAGLFLLPSSTAFIEPTIAATGSAHATAICNQTLDTTTAVVITYTNNGECLLKFTSGANSWTAPVAVTEISYLVVGAGGAGGSAYDVASTGGGGGGEVLAGSLSVNPGSVYAISVGLGGKAPTGVSASVFTGAAAATSTTFAGIVARAGGAGSSRNNRTTVIGATAIFTGGGGSGQYSEQTLGAIPSGVTVGGSGGNAYATTASSTKNAGGGGGGAGGNGEAGFQYNSSFTSGVYAGGKGGLGISNSLESGTAQFYGAGGGGGIRSNVFLPGPGGSGVGGTGGSGPFASIVSPTSGATNSGSGGGGAGTDGGGTAITVGGSGADGVVLIRYTPNLKAFPGVPSLSGNAVKGIAKTLTIQSEFAGKVTFSANGRVIPGCRNVLTTSVYPLNTATCSWKPTVQGSVRITASMIPTDSSFSPASNTYYTNVQRRTNNR